MSPTPGVERRRMPRAQLEGDVQFSTAGKSFTGRFLDISPLGIRFAGEPTCPPGTELNLHVTLPGTGRVLQLGGRVAWEEPGRGMGIEFRDVTNAMQIELLESLFRALQGA